jgi:predicted phage-related endonuclease
LPYIIIRGDRYEHERTERHRPKPYQRPADDRRLQAEAEALTDKIKAAMVEQGTEALQGNGWKATWRNVNSSRFDSKSFKQDHADLYSQYSKATTTTRFVLSV